MSDVVSSATDDTLPRWGEIAGLVARQFGLTTLRSPTLKLVVERGARYIHVDKDVRELVFDTRALVLGFLAAGQSEPDSIRYGNTASWFVEWVVEQFGASSIPSLRSLAPMSVPEDVFAVLEQESRVILSVSVRALLKPARSFSLLTVGRREFEARHLFGAMIVKGVVADQVRQIFQYKVEPTNIDALRSALISRVMGAPEKGETIERWNAAFERIAADPDADLDDQPRAPEGVSPFISDAVGAREDVLGVAREVRALARLICLDDIAPLAVAILGGWGTGKSTLMNRLEFEVQGIATAQTGHAPANDPGSAHFIQRVVQVRFNAWQFVDANLWASLTAEFFDQLRAGGWDRAGTARYAGLVSQVNSHVHALNHSLEEKRRVVAEGGKHLLEAQRARDQAAKDAAKADGRAVGQATLNTLSELYESQKSNLKALGLEATGVNTAPSIDAILDAVETSGSIFSQALLVIKLIKRSRLALIVASVGALIVFVACLVFRSSGNGPIVWALVTGLTTLGTFATAITPAIRFVASVAKRAGNVAESVDAAERETLKDLVKTEVELTEAAREAEARQEAAQDAERRLARYVDPEGSANPPRLLRYVLEDDPNTRALQSELGLIGRTRRLFQAVNDIVQKERRKLPSEPRDLEVPDRIVLYIDDLDRCSVKQVYAVLQAIHLLLAFELFVVVVGVDVEWIEHAVAQSVVGGGAGKFKPAERKQQAARYLEKIFQVAYWLNSLSSGEGTEGSYGRYVRSLTADHARVASASSAPPVMQNLPKDEAAVTGAGLSAGDAGNGNKATSSDSASDESLAMIQLEAVEVELLACDEIAAIAARTPRSVKRLINVYRLVRGTLADSGVVIVGDENDPPSYPLIAIAVAIETGQPVTVADAFWDGMAKLNASAPLHEGLRETGTLVQAARLCPGLRAAFDKAAQLRNGDLQPADMVAVARIARRYSFNRYN